MPRDFARTLSVAQSSWRRLRRDESGSVLAYMVVIPVLAGALAIGVETGELYRVKHQMQDAADDAALAASIDLIAGKSTATASADATYEAQRNGFTNGSNSVNVTVNVPPTSGSNVGTTNAVQVVITKTQSLTFGAVLNSWLGRTSNGYALTTSSVAIPSPYSTSAATTTSSTSTTTTTTSVGCLVALTPNNEQGVSFTNFSSFTSDCLVMSNGTATGTGSNASINMSNFSSATFTKGSGTWNTTAGGVWTRGTFSATNYSSLTIPTGETMINQTTSIVDPYAGLAAPSPGTCTKTNYSTPGGNSVTVPVGNYCGGLTVDNNSTAYFQPGTYYITNGNFVISGVSSVSCPTCTGTAGTTFVLTQTTGNNANIGGVSISNESTITLNAPTVSSATTAYPYPGVLFFQDRNAPAGTMSSTSNIFSLSNLSTATLSGAIYFPKNAIKVSNLSSTGSSSSTGCTVWIGRYIQFSSYSSNYVSGCTSATTPAGYSTTTTTTTTTTTPGSTIYKAQLSN